jgi:hypothetical protein
MKTLARILSMHRTEKALARLAAAAAVPFLVIAFILHFLYPDESGRRFAWKIQPCLRAISIGAGYLGGTYPFTQAVFCWPRRSTSATLPPEPYKLGLAGAALV